MQGEYRVFDPAFIARRLNSLSWFLTNLSSNSPTLSKTALRQIWAILGPCVTCSFIDGLLRIDRPPPNNEFRANSMAQPVSVPTSRTILPPRQSRSYFLKSRAACFNISGGLYQCPS